MMTGQYETFRASLERSRGLSRGMKLQLFKVCALAILAIVLVIRFELYETVERHLRRVDRSWELDQLLGVFVVLTTALTYLTIARWRDLNREARVRQKAEQGLLESEHRLRVLFSGSPSAMVALNEESRRILEVNPEFERLTGYARREVLGLSLSGIRLWESPDVEARISSADTALERHRSLETTLRARNDERRIVLLSSDRVVIDGAKTLLLSFHDITERKELERQLAHQALHDALTGLPNRVLFLDRVMQALARTRRQRSTVSVLFIDLDDFKVVNDTLGHSSGDALLREVAARISHPLRSADTCARLGGDEFAILLEDDGSASTAQVVSERILNGLRDTFDIGGKSVFIGASIGIATTHSDEDAGELIRRADVAMYVAKTGGKHRASIFEPSMHATLVRRAELHQELRGAIDRGEFSLHYQPIISLDSREILGFEALLRWQHPERGTVPPSEFITVAEQSGIIVELGWWVRRTACTAASSWPAAASGRELTVTVNVSARELRETDFVEGVRKLLKETGLAPQRLVLEMTENVLVANDTTTLQRLHALKDIGVLLAIDDFGTGYSSLSYLQQFPVDIIKIDKSFIDGLGEEQLESPLSRAVVSLGRVLSISTVAEGVETEEQFRRLLELGCPLGQGFLFARPMPDDGVSELLARHATSGSAPALEFDGKLALIA
jgi:diguanylate cyclase (GGDEF)-like protein/PAS domain S-box-containing protein